MKVWASKPITVCTYNSHSTIQDADRQPDPMQEAALAVSVMLLQEELDRVTQELASLENSYAEMEDRADGYRMDWINDYRRAELLSVGDDTCLSQARWDAPSPY